MGGFRKPTSRYRDQIAMKNISLHIILVISAILISVACTKEEITKGNESEIVIDASIMKSNEQAKAIITTDRFGDQNTLGLFVYHAEYELPLDTLSAYGDKYKNIRAKYSSNEGWKYSFESSLSSTFNRIYLLNPSVEVFTQGLAIVAYAPYKEGTTAINNIQFKTGGNSKDVTDLLWASQNNTSENAKIVPDGNVKDVKLSFKHAFAMIKCGFKCKWDAQTNGEYTGSTMRVTAITLKKKNGGSTRLYTSGSFNALDGSLNNLIEPDTLKISTYYSNENYTFKYNATEYVYVPMLIIPTEYINDGDYILEFKFNNQKVSEYPIKREDIKTRRNGVDVYAFEAGYTYTFNFTFNNYIQLDKASISDTWVPVVQNPIVL